MNKGLAIFFLVLLCSCNIKKGDGSKLSMTDFDKWNVHAGSDDIEHNFSIENETLRFTGYPGCYIFSKDSFVNYSLEFQWRWVDDEEDDFSGAILIHIQKESDSPNAKKIELKKKKSGNIELLNGASVYPYMQDSIVDNNIVSIRDTADIIDNPVGQWNKMRINCEFRTISIYLNDEFVNKIENLKEAKGFIGIQSDKGKLEIKDLVLYRHPLYVCNGVVITHEAYTNIDPDKITSSRWLTPVEADTVFGDFSDHGVLIVTTFRHKK